MRWDCSRCKVQLKNFLIGRFRLFAVIVLLIGLQTRLNPTLPVVAQGGGTGIVGTPVTSASKRVVNFADEARLEASNPRTSQAPVAVHSPAHVKEPSAPPSSRAPQVVLPAQPRVASPLPAASFQAVGDTLDIIPPDTTGAVGVDHLVTTLNSQVRIQDKNGTTISSVALSTFWGFAGVFDPRVVYDPFYHRWIHIVVFGAASANSALCIAISQTNLPTGVWNLYCIDVDSTNTLWADYPQVGFNKDWIVVSMNMFPISTGSPRGQIYAFNKTSLYAGVFEAYFWNSIDVPYPVSPAVTYDNTLANENLIQHGNSGGGVIYKHVITGSPPGAPTLSSSGLPVNSQLGPWSVPDFPSGQVLPQAGGANMIEIIDARMMNAVVRTVGGVTSLWCAQDIALPAGGSPTHWAVQWWQLDADPASTWIYQQGRIEDPTATQANGGYHYAYPSLAVNQYGDMMIGFSRFSSAEYASGTYAFRYSTDIANTTRDPVVFKAGEGHYFKTFGKGRNRWGDFSNTVIDPMGDVNFWTIQEYAAAPVGVGDGSGRWGTWWGMVKLSDTIPSTHFFPVIQKNP